MEIIVSVVLVAGLAYWMRGYSPKRQIKKQTETKNGFEEFMRHGQLVKREIPRFEEPARARHTVCETCGDPLNDAQLTALRGRDLACPGGKRVGKPCPYWGERTLN